MILNVFRLSLNLQQNNSSRIPRTSSSRCSFQNFSVGKLTPPADEISRIWTQVALEKRIVYFFKININC